jgi:hypothetical protein
MKSVLYNINRMFIHHLSRLHTPPGTKFLVMKSIPIRDHTLMLDQGMLKELGGHVIELVQAWRSGKVG